MFAAISGATVRLLGHLAKRNATGEGDLISGANPATFTSSDPLRLWIIQVGVIIITAQLLSLCLRHLKQPKVISEVLGGILLGPTGFGRIPGFTENIFPPESIPYLSLVANIGLCLFLFLVGLEIDTSVIRRNARVSIAVSLAGIALPFGLGTVLSVPLYRYFVDPSVHFTYFMLFTGVAYSITAFPVLCRILTELRLLDTDVGAVVLSAGVGNNIIGWILLALCVALVNAGSGLSALWILFVCIAFTILLLFPVKFGMRWLARKTGSTERGPTVFYMTVVIILVWTCAFFTDAVGVNAIFGTFLAGLVVPREGGLTIALTEKLEDMVSIVFLPLYFALSGLNTDLELLNNGITWAFTLAIIALSFSGKFGGCTIASRLAGYGWRESSAVGALMSCKGLVELIVLNVGLQAGILSQRVFSMFVLEALALTFITTPLVVLLYPPECRAQARATIPPPKGDEHGQADSKASLVTEEQPWRHRFTIVLDKPDHIPCAMALTKLVVPPCDVLSDAMTTRNTFNKPTTSDVRVQALRLIEPSDRTSAAMALLAAGSSVHTDPALGIFRTFGELNELAVTTSLSVVPYADFAQCVAEHAQRHCSHLVLLPWSMPSAPVAVDPSDVKVAEGEHYRQTFDALFGGVSGCEADKVPSAVHSQFVRGVFAQSKTDVALFVDTSDPPGAAHVGGPTHVFLPFVGGPDDRLALELVVQLCLNPRTTATVVRIVRTPEGTTSLENKSDSAGAPSGHLPGAASSIARFQRGRQTSDVGPQSDVADDVAWAKYASVAIASASTDTASTSTIRSDSAEPRAHAVDGDASTPALRDALSRIHFSDVHTPTPVHAAIQHARALREASPRLLVIAGRSRRDAKEGEREREREGDHAESKWAVADVHRPGMDMEVMRRTIGDVGAAMVMSGGSTSGVVVVQSAGAVLG